jgi:hypothetical protein
MKTSKLTVLVIFFVAFALTTAYTNAALSHDGATEALTGADNQLRMERFSPKGEVAHEAPAGWDAGQPGSGNESDKIITLAEAPTGFDNLTNGFDVQGQPFDTLDEDNVVPLRSMNDNRFIFEETETNADGLGPTYNTQSCRECHQNVATGGASQIAEHRTGRTENGVFFESLGGSLIQSRAIHPDVVERVAFEDGVRTFRISTNTLGNGFVECIANETLLLIRDRQPADVRGTALTVPVLEANSSARIGRFGWKSQHASLESFAADAYLNEMGITSPLFPTENTSGGRDVAPYDSVADKRRCVHRSERIGEQDHPSVQRFLVARHRHRRWHPLVTHTRIRDDSKSDPYGPAVGAQDTESADARWPVVHEAGSY